MYNVDWSKLVQESLPFAIRKPRIIALLMAFLMPLIMLYNRFLSFRKKTNRELKVTGQVRILRYWLNWTFDFGNDRISILDGDSNDTIFIFLESENDPVYLPEFITGSTIDFIVRVPNELQNEDAQIRNFLNRFKLASKRYRIDYYNPAN